MSATSHAVDSDRELPEGRHGDHALLAQQLPVIGEMLGSLDTLTIAAVDDNQNIMRIWT